MVYGNEARTNIFNLRFIKKLKYHLNIDMEKSIIEANTFLIYFYPFVFSSY